MKKFSIELKWALIFGIVALLWMVGEKSMGLHGEYIEKHAIYTNLFALVAIAVYIIAMRDKRKNYYNGQMTWTQGFISGCILSLLVTLLSPLTQYITSTYISPEYFQNVIDYSVENGLHTREQAQEYFSLKNYIVMGAIGALSMGIVTSAIVALFVKSKKS